MIRRLAAAALLLAASVFLLLLARDAWHWQRAMADADTRASIRAVSPAAWNAHATLPHDLARRLLGLDDDIEYRATATRAAALAANEVSPKTYPQYCFNLSPTFDTWCLLKATDFASLEVHPGFEGACATQTIYVAN